MELKGWIERNGELLGPDEIEKIIGTDPGAFSGCGGEFALSWNGCTARDHLGVMPGPGQAGMVACGGKQVVRIVPPPSDFPLDEAIAVAVRLRNGEGVVALSGGVDSALVAALARRECVAVGTEGSHDLRRACHVAAELDLALTTVTLTERMIEEALPGVIRAIPHCTPLDVSIAATLSFVASWAHDHGYERILSGQGADELFGGYARYLNSGNLAAELEHDFRALKNQLARDQAVAARYAAAFSLPYLDCRVVRAARAIPASEKVCKGVRKCQLREVAARHMPREIAFYEKKAMQYGSGVWRTMQRLARQNGYKKSVQGYLNYIGSAEYGL